MHQVCFDSHKNQCLSVTSLPFWMMTERSPNQPIDQTTTSWWASYTFNKLKHKYTWIQLCSACCWRGRRRPAVETGLPGNCAPAAGQRPRTAALPAWHWPRGCCSGAGWICRSRRSVCSRAAAWPGRRHCCWAAADAAGCCCGSLKHCEEKRRVIGLKKSCITNNIY